MHCLFIFRDSLGRLPDADQLRRLGFRVSLAALPQDETAPGAVAAPEPGGAGGLALAAEPPAAYGSVRPIGPGGPAAAAAETDGAA